jgi:hypothetical protein
MIEAPIRIGRSGRNARSDDMWVPRDLYAMVHRPVYFDKPVGVLK